MRGEEEKRLGEHDGHLLGVRGRGRVRDITMATWLYRVGVRVRESTMATWLGSGLGLGLGTGLGLGLGSGLDSRPCGAPG